MFALMVAAGWTAGTPVEACLVAEVTLDGTGTCPGPVAYRWMLGAQTVRD